MTTNLSFPASTATASDEDFPFVVGDRLAWGAGYLRITAIGHYRFLALTFSPHQSVYEDPFRKTDTWQRYSGDVHRHDR